MIWPFRKYSYPPNVHMQLIEHLRQAASTRVRRKTVQGQSGMQNAKCDIIAKPCKTLERAANNNNQIYGENGSVAILHKTQGNFC